VIPLRGPLGPGVLAIKVSTLSSLGAAGYLSAVPDIGPGQDPEPRQNTPDTSLPIIEAVILLGADHPSCLDKSLSPPSVALCSKPAGAEDGCVLGRPGRIPILS